jgi:tetratricopeptide (TPR) repeat protein
MSDHSRITRIRQNNSDPRQRIIQKFTDVLLTCACHRVSVILFSMLLFSACTLDPTYFHVDPILPPNEMALIQNFDSTLSISSCDGKRIISPKIWLLPGEHALTASIHRNDNALEVYTYTGDVTLRFNAEAGHRYRLAYNLSSLPNKALFFIVDQATGSNVRLNLLTPPQTLDKQDTKKTFGDHPVNAVYWFNRGYILMQLKNYEDAIVAFERSISIRSNSAYPWKFKSEALYESKRYEDALNAIMRAIELHPNESQWYLLRNKIMEKEQSDSNGLKDASVLKDQ